MTKLIIHLDFNIMVANSNIFWWVRSDFRLLDNPALFASYKEFKRTGAEFLPIAFLDRELLEDGWMNIGYGRRKMVSRILSKFAAKFGRFLIVVGDVDQGWQVIAENLNCNVHVNDDGEPYAVSRFNKVQGILNNNGGSLTVNADYLTVSLDAASMNGNMYSVFGPFKRNVQEKFLQKMTFPVPELKEIHYCDPTSWTFLNKLNGFLVTGDKFKTFGNNPHIKDGDSLEKVIFDLIDRPNILHFGTNRGWQLNPKSQNFQGTHTLNIDKLWPRPDLSYWYDTEEEAIAVMNNFIDKGLHKYEQLRNYLSHEAGSNLSTALKWGLVSSRTVAHNIQAKITKIDQDPNAISFISELIWREFYRYLLKHQPRLLDQEFQPKFRSMIWTDGEVGVERLTRWIEGRTGYPAVDAAMNQIARTGYMHNRARMMVASILTKNLGIDWRWGQDYFRLMLVDLDEASNNGGWQWASSVGADPKPIRIFNPYLQATNWDKFGDYQKKWLPQNYFAGMKVFDEVEFEKVQIDGLTPKGQTHTFQPKTNTLFPEEIKVSAENITIDQVFANYNYQKLLDMIVPVINHKIARQQALDRYGLAKSLPSTAVRDF